MEPQPARFVDGGMDGESSPEEDGDGYLQEVPQPNHMFGLVQKGTAWYGEVV